MRREEFALALNALLPGCDMEAADKWADFAVECVDQDQFAYFIPVEGDAAVENWMDAIYAGLYAVRQEYGTEIAAEVAGLSCQRCAVYPGEMMQVAEVLKNGGDAEQISGMIDSDQIESKEPLFFDLPDGAALTCRGPEISVAQTGVPCGLLRKRTEPGYLLADGTALLKGERDDFGRFWGGAGMDGMDLKTGKLYAPVRGVDIHVRAFREVRPVLAKEREAAFLTSEQDGFILYHLKGSGTPLARLQKEGGSPLDAGYHLVHIVYTKPVGAGYKTLEMCRSMGVLSPGDILAFKQGSMVTCWYMDQLAYSRLPGLLESYMKTAELGAEQNYNQIDGIINNEAPKPSLRNTLRQHQREAASRSQDDSSPGRPHPASER